MREYPGMVVARIPGWLAEEAQKARELAQPMEKRRPDILLLHAIAHVAREAADGEYNLQLSTRIIACLEDKLWELSIDK